MYRESETGYGNLYRETNVCINEHIHDYDDDDKGTREYHDCVTHTLWSIEISTSISINKNMYGITLNSIAQAFKFQNFDDTDKTWGPFARGGNKFHPTKKKGKIFSLITNGVRVKEAQTKKPTH